jgi:hypothetical protein
MQFAIRLGVVQLIKYLITNVMQNYDTKRNNEYGAGVRCELCGLDFVRFVRLECV